MAHQRFEAATLEPRVKTLLESADLEALAQILDPNVHWGVPDDPDQTCQNRQQVIAWWKRARDAGVRAQVNETAVIGERILVGIHVVGRRGATGNGERWQVFTVAPHGVVEIAGFETRDEALAYANSTDAG